MLLRPLVLFFLLFAIGTQVWAQTIRGEVLDIDGRKPINNVTIVNIHTDFVISTGEDGSFIINATSGQLLEFRRGGYVTARVRIPQGFVPPFFRILLQKGVSPLRDMYVVNSNRYDYHKDSLKFHELYKHELDFAKMSGIEMIAHPFSAMSGKNREIWQFQDDYDNFEKEKYVDMTFSDAIVTRFTGLSGDSLRSYKRRYRPTYEQLRSMNDYNFYNFIKTSVYKFRSYVRPVFGQ